MNEAAQVTLEEAIDLAQSQHAAGNLLIAERAYKDILNSVPDHFDSVHMLGVIQYQKGNLPEALKYIEQALELEPDDPRCLNNYGIILSNSGKKHEAVAAWEKAITINPKAPDPYFNAGNTLWELKEYERAEDMCRKALEIEPESHHAWLNLGNALQGQEKLDEAIECWLKAAEINPEMSKAYGNLGNAYHTLGRYQEAEEQCRKALELDPKNVEAWNNLGNAMRDLGRPTEAEGAYRTAIKLRPNFKYGHNNLAIALIDQLRFDEAAASARFAIAFDESYGDAWGNLSVAARELGDFDEAEKAAMRAVSLKPDSASAYADLSDILFVQERMEEAEAALDEARKLEGDSPRLYLKLANILERSNKMEEALEAVDKAVSENPELMEGYYKKAQIYFTSNFMKEAEEAANKALELSKGNIMPNGIKAEILLAQGKLDEARALLEEGIENNERMTPFYQSLVKIRKFTADDPIMQKMEKLAKNIDKMGQQAAISLCFALYDAYEDFGEFDKAFEYLQKGNDLKRRTLPYKTAINEKSHANVKKMYTPERAKEFKGVGYNSDVPVFILGMPRSGTTLTEQILSAHPDVYGAGELIDMGLTDKAYPVTTLENAKEKGKFYVDSIKKRGGNAARITDKMPGNYMRIGDIRAILPNAKIINCRRNPIDNCLSCYKQLFARGQFWSYNLEELAHQYHQYALMMDHWREIYSDEFLDFDYEDTVDNFEEQARKLVKFVGLDWHDACLEPHKAKRSVITASKTQVIKPIYSSSVKGWKRYEKQLQPLIDALGEDLLKNYL